MKYSILLITIFTPFFMTIVAEEDPLARINAYREKQAKKPPKQVYPYYANPDGIEVNYTYGTSPLKTLYVSPDGSGNTFSLKKPGQLSGPPKRLGRSKPWTVLGQLRPGLGQTPMRFWRRPLP